MAAHYYVGYTALHSTSHQLCTTHWQWCCTQVGHVHRQCIARSKRRLMMVWCLIHVDKSAKIGSFACIHVRHVRTYVVYARAVYGGRPLRGLLAFCLSFAGKWLRSPGG